MAKIREIRPSEAGAVTDLYLAWCRAEAERDPNSGVPERDPILRWIQRTCETDEAICLVAEIGGRLGGFQIASVSRHPAMPGVSGELEGLYVRSGPGERDLRRKLVDAGIAWARERHANVIITIVGLDSPSTGDEIAFWESLGFLNDTTELRLYGQEGC